MEVTVRTIETEADYDAALAEVYGLMDAEPGTPDDARLDVLTTLIEAYEARHWAIDPPDPIEAIRACMEQRNLTRNDLEPMIGSRGRVSEVLSRKRALTLPMIRKLSRGLGLRADVLIQEVRVAPRTRAKPKHSRTRAERTPT
jgi:HTH-type transcriptional regulator/antitoxin HigA